MRQFLGIVLVLVLAAIAGAAGYFGMTVYKDARGYFDGFAHACRTLEFAENKQVLSHEQRAAIVAFMLPGEKEEEGAESIEPIIDYLNSDCSKSLWSVVTERS